MQVSLLERGSKALALFWWGGGRGGLGIISISRVLMMLYVKGMNTIGIRCLPNGGETGEGGAADLFF